MLGACAPWCASVDPNPMPKMLCGMCKRLISAERPLNAHFLTHAYDTRLTQCIFFATYCSKADLVCGKIIAMY